MEEALNNKQIRTHLGEEKIQWGYCQNYSFTMKEAYDILTGANIQPMDERWKKIWKKIMWPKITVFNWIVMRKHILIGEHIQKKEWWDLTGASCMSLKKKQSTIS